MRLKLQTGLLGLTLLAMSAGAPAFAHDPHDGAGRNGYGYATGPGGINLIDQVSRDVATVRSRSRVDGHERSHFDTVQRELSNFQRRWAKGHFDKGKLDNAIGSLSHLVDSDQIDPRGRRILANDLADLRNFRANERGYRGHGEYGPYDNGRYNPYEPR